MCDRESISRMQTPAKTLKKSVIHICRFDLLQLDETYDAKSVHFGLIIIIIIIIIILFIMVKT